MEMAVCGCEIYQSNASNGITSIDPDSLSIFERFKVDRYGCKIDAQM